MINEISKKLNNKKIGILGFGREGKSTYNFIKEYCTNYEITIIDKIDYSENVECKCIYGDDYLNNLDNFDLIIKSPGISLNDIDITKFKEKITSQMELFLEVNRNNCIGITGTKGKSTTTSLIYQILKEQNIDVCLAGNIGIPILNELKNIKKDTKVILEMSSHQLELLKVSPHIGIILNLFQDHLDYAKTLEHYHKSKLNMLYNQTNKDIGIVNYDNDYLKKYIQDKNIKSNIIEISFKEQKDVFLKENIVYYNNTKLFNISEKTNLIGEHNIFNIVVSLIVSNLLKLDIKKSIKTIKDFHPLQNRIEQCGNYKDIIYYTDTLATIPEATIATTQGLKNVNTLIIGGLDRGIDYKLLIDFLNKNKDIKNLICMPETGYKIANRINNNNMKILLATDLKEAVNFTKVISHGICLLSPAAPSYNKFKNYEEKTKYYVEYINNIE